jgi:hypothetical protein
VVYGWGAATIDDEPVLVFDSDVLLAPLAFATDWGLGIHFVEPTEDYEIGYRSISRRILENDAATSVLVVALSIAKISIWLE